MPPDRLFVSDLDGTLFDTAGRLTPFARRELTAMLDAGLPFTVASARSIASMRIIMGELPLRLPVITVDGAFVTDYATGEHLLVRAMDAGLVAPVAEAGREAGIHPFFSTFNGSEDCLYHPEPINDGMWWYVRDRQRARDSRLRPLLPAADPLGDQVVGLTFIERPERLAPLRQWVVERFGARIWLHSYENPYDPGWHWLTVHDGQADKAQALHWVAAEHDVPMAGVTAFGDGLNDLPLFRAVGHGVAVGNAPDELKALAAEVIGPHHADSVIHYLREHWDGGS